MSGREATFWDELRPKLMKVPGTDLTRIENGIVPGTPDVNGCIHRVDFWCELKCMPRGYDHKKTGIFEIDHYTINQRNWIRRRGKAGGRVSLALKIVYPREYMLFQWPAAFHVVGKVPLKELRNHAIVYAPNAIPVDAFITGLLLPPPLTDEEYVKAL